MVVVVAVAMHLSQLQPMHKKSARTYSVVAELQLGQRPVAVQCLRQRDGSCIAYLIVR